MWPITLFQKCAMCLQTHHSWLERNTFSIQGTKHFMSQLSYHAIFLCQKVSMHVCKYVSFC